jgi:HEPN domain-containing protein/predicted nucleotidyltransferase
MTTTDQIREALRSAQLPFRVVGAVLFGSQVKGTATPDSDFDLLIVAEGIPLERHHRSREIVSLSHCIPVLPLDILLLTPAETLANFHSHNPLFLDIAEEGIPILDDNHWLANLIQQTRRYIREKGIRRCGDGWIFPVKRGVPTPLSEVSNFDFAQAMLQDGQRDYEIGKQITESGYYDKAVYHFQQAVEKGVKAILIAMGISQKTHFVGKILRQIVWDTESLHDWQARLLEVAEISEGIEPEVSLSRYPGVIERELWLPFERYRRERAISACADAGKVLDVSRAFLEDWFANE